MKRQTKTKFFTMFLLVSLLIISFFVGGGVSSKAYAVTSSERDYSNVLNDLQQDNEFDISEYPENFNDYSLQVIQIAESTDGELFIYVYQPCARVKDLRASSIRLSQTTGINISPRDYKLTFLNSSGVFYKYKVEGLELRKDVIRYYDITAIHRPFDKVIDTGASGGNVVNEVVFKVGQVWTATTLNDNVTYSMYETEVIEITEKYVGFTQYDDGTKVGWGITNGLTRAHFVAFSTNRRIDKLISADVAFMEQDVKCKICANVTHLWHDFNKPYDYKYSDPYQHLPNPLTIHYSDRGTGGGYVWDRIRSTADWLKDENNKDYQVTTEGETNISGTQWVLNFYETQIQAEVDGVWAPLISALALPFVGDGDVRYKRVSDVTILRLSFETDGTTYNLGVVDNKQTGNQKPDNKYVGDGSIKSATPWWVWLIVAAGVVVVVLILVCVCVPGAAPVIFNGIGTGLKWACIGIAYAVYYFGYGVWWFVSLPFRAFKKHKSQPKRSTTKPRKTTRKKAGKSK